MKMNLVKVSVVSVVTLTALVFSFPILVEGKQTLEGNGSAPDPTPTVTSTPTPVPTIEETPINQTVNPAIPTPTTTQPITVPLEGSSCN